MAAPIRGRNPRPNTPVMLKNIPSGDFTGDQFGLGGARQGTGAVSAFNPITNEQQSVGAAPVAPVNAGPTVGADITAPGIQGVTPGAIERKLGFAPPTVQASGAPQSPTDVATALRDIGPSREAFTAPLDALQNLIRNRRRGM